MRDRGGGAMKSVRAIGLNDGGSMKPLGTRLVGKFARKGNDILQYIQIQLQDSIIACILALVVPYFFFMLVHVPARGSIQQIATKCFMHAIIPAHNIST